MAFAAVVLRPARPVDAGDIARILRAARATWTWMPVLHTPAEDLAFIAGKVLPAQTVTVAERDRELVGFIAIDGEWIEHLYVDPRYASRGIGRRLLQHATASMASVRLHCFQSNARARSFYEREGFVAASFGDGSGNEEGLPDILYARER